MMEQHKHTHNAETSDVKSLAEEIYWDCLLLNGGSTTADPEVLEVPDVGTDKGVGADTEADVCV